MIIGKVFTGICLVESDTFRVCRVITEFSYIHTSLVNQSKIPRPNPKLKTQQLVVIFIWPIDIWSCQGFCCFLFGSTLILSTLYPGFWSYLLLVDTIMFKQPFHFAKFRNIPWSREPLWTGLTWHVRFWLTWFWHEWHERHPT